MGSVLSEVIAGTALDAIHRCTRLSSGNSVSYSDQIESPLSTPTPDSWNLQLHSRPHSDSVKRRPRTRTPFAACSAVSRFRCAAYGRTPGRDSTGRRPAPRLDATASSVNRSPLPHTFDGTSVYVEAELLRWEVLIAPGYVGGASGRGLMRVQVSERASSHQACIPVATASSWLLSLEILSPCRFFASGPLLMNGCRLT